MVVVLPIPGELELCLYLLILQSVSGRMFSVSLLASLAREQLTAYLVVVDCLLS